MRWEGEGTHIPSQLETAKSVIYKLRFWKRVNCFRIIISFFFLFNVFDFVLAAASPAQQAPPYNRKQSKIKIVGYLMTRRYPTAPALFLFPVRVQIFLSSESRPEGVRDPHWLAPVASALPGAHRFGACWVWGSVLSHYTKIDRKKCGI